MSDVQQQEREQTALGDVLADLSRDGYAIVERVLDDRQVATVRAELDRLLGQVDVGDNSFVGYKTKRVFSAPAKTRVTDALATQPLVLGVLDDVLSHYLLSAPVIISIGPGERAQTLHRDETTYPVPRGLAGELVVNVMWAIDDFTQANGATRIIPGSHTWPDTSAATREQTIGAVMPAGSMCVFLGSVVHGGGENSTDSPRLGIVMEYAAAWLRPQENLALAVPRDVARQMPERMQQLIGYDMYPPFLGYVDGGSPMKLLEDRDVDGDS